MLQVVPFRQLRPQRHRESKTRTGPVARKTTALLTAERSHPRGRGQKKRETTTHFQPNRNSIVRTPTIANTETPFHIPSPVRQHRIEFGARSRSALRVEGRLSARDPLRQIALLRQSWTTSPIVVHTACYRDRVNKDVRRVRH